MSKNPSKIADYAAILLAIGTYIFLCVMIWLEYQTSGELNPWMLGSLITMLLLSLGTLFGFGRLESVLEKVPVSFGNSK